VDDGNVLWNPARTLAVNFPRVVLVTRDEGGPVPFPWHSCDVSFEGCSLLFPAALPAEQDMREVGLPAVEDGAEPGGSAGCPQRRVSRACCPQIRFLGPMGPSFLLRFELTGGRAGGQQWSRWWVVSVGEPSPWVWLRDGTDRLFHAVSVWELPPEEDGPTAVCGRRVLVVSLLDEPDGGRCPKCVGAVAGPGGSGRERGRPARG
jgi:hypothetical protein